MFEVVPTNAWLNTVAYAGIFMAIDKGSMQWRAAFVTGRLRKLSSSSLIAKGASRAS